MNAPMPAAINFEKRVEQFVRLRDEIKRIEQQQKDVLKPYKETLEKLKSVLLGYLNAVNTDSTKTAAGTVYRTVKKSASIADMTAFQAWVITQGDWNLVDWKANVTAVADYLADQEQKVATGAQMEVVPLPGVNFTQTIDVGVRRK
jgi:hypothetical protein